MTWQNSFGATLGRRLHNLLADRPLVVGAYATRGYGDGDGRIRLRRGDETSTSGYGPGICESNARQRRPLAGAGRRDRS